MIEVCAVAVTRERVLLLLFFVLGLLVDSCFSDRSETFRIDYLLSFYILRKN
jgi:hypothetical protein